MQSLVKQASDYRADRLTIFHSTFKSLEDGVGTWHIWGEVKRNTHVLVEESEGKIF